MVLETEGRGLGTGCKASSGATSVKQDRWLRGHRETSSTGRPQELP